MEDKRIDLILENIVQLASGDFNLKEYSVKKQDSIDAIGLGLTMLGEHLSDTMASKALLDKSIEEKNILLKEIHHRVKNNLQIITSLLGLQSSLIKDEKINAIFLQSQQRIRSIALVHEMLYHTSDLSQINYPDYLVQLAGALLNSMKSDQKKIECEVQAPEVYLNISTAIPVGLIVNELITNSLKHAFDGRGSGLILISLQDLGSKRFKLNVSDNGIGSATNILQHQSLGLRLIHNLVAQLNGEIKLLPSNKGTEFEILFSSVD